MTKKYEIRCKSHAINANCPRWVKIEGDYHKIDGGNLYIYEENNLVHVIQNDEWLEMSISNIPEEETTEEMIERLTPLVVSPDLIGIGLDIQTELFHAELKHHNVKDEFRKSAQGLIDGTGDGEVANVIIKMIDQKWKDRGDID